MLWHMVVEKRLYKCNVHCLVYLEFFEFVHNVGGQPFIERGHRIKDRAMYTIARGQGRQKNNSKNQKRKIQRIITTCN
jgi:hypothetical protein